MKTKPRRFVVGFKDTIGIEGTGEQSIEPMLASELQSYLIIQPDAIVYELVPRPDLGVSKGNR